MEYASAAFTAMKAKKTALTAAPAATAANPQPPTPASRNTLASAAANHMRLRIARPRMTTAIRIRVRSPW
jgi:hypothetical protein